jgi:beta-galactosidase
MSIPSSVVLRRRRLLLDGVPRLVMSGEVHYFRLDRSDWAHRLGLLRESGCDTVATYVPWLWHELPDGSVDVTGKTHERRDLAGFLDLAGGLGLRAIVRPGPFIMAEMKNEGVPYRVYDDHPDVWPITWDGQRVPTRTADYLAPDFLRAAQGWYAEVMPVVADRLCTRGGPVIGVQLDNEIGMLSWVTNSPDLTEVTCEDMRAWARKRYGVAGAGARVGTDPDDPKAWAEALRRPPEDRTLSLHHQLGLYMRDRYRRYVAVLRATAEGLGVTGVPWFVNVHGTIDRRGRAFPIGISQLFESYRGQPQMTSGSDLYLGDLTVTNVGDLYTANAFMAAMHDVDQPITSMEFEAGSGDYGQDMGTLVAPESIELKTRLCVAQGNRLVNFYLFSGGTNPPLEQPVGDGNDRVAFTGEQHGFAAPVGPEGRRGPSFAATQRAVTSLAGVADLLADMDEEHDGLALGFVPDHYLSEYAYPHSETRRAQVRDLERFRGMGPRDVLARALLLCGMSFPAVDLQHEDVDVRRVPALALASPSVLSRDVQERLVRYLHSGGRLLLHGVLPRAEHDGTPCAVLADALSLSVAGQVEERGVEYYPSVLAHGWAAPRAETRVRYAQLLAHHDGTEMKAVLTEKGTGMVCAAEIAVGAGRALVIACDYPCQVDFWRAALTALDVEPRWQVQSDQPGLVVTSTSDAYGQRLLHLVHVGTSPVRALLSSRRGPYLGRPIHLAPRSGLVLPAGVELGGGRLTAATCEIVERCDGRAVLRPTQPDGDVVVVETDRVVTADVGTVYAENGLARIEIPPGGDRVEVSLGWA